MWLRQVLMWSLGKLLLLCNILFLSLSNIPLCLYMYTYIDIYILHLMLFVCWWPLNLLPCLQFSSVAQSCPTLWPHELQHARPPCPSPTPGVHPNPCPLSRWYHPTISCSVVPFSSCPQSFPASGSFPLSQLFVSGGQSTGVSASKSVLPMNSEDWSPVGWTGWISLQSKSLLQHHSSKALIPWCSAFFTVQLSHPYMTTGKTIALTRRTFVGKVMSAFYYAV